MMTKRIYLASRSPRRGEILTQLGIAYEVMPSDLDESVRLNEDPETYVLRLAKEKAEVCVAKIKENQLKALPVLAADTTVAMDGEVLGKPENDADAVRMLKHLSGRSHWVYTAIAVAKAKKVEVSLSATMVCMAELTMEQIMAYVATGEPRDKAGAYGIQGLASTFIKRIDGSYSGVMGLPIFETAQLLSKFGVSVL